MAGKIKKMIDKIIAERAKGDKVVESTTRTKLALKGINVSQYSAFSEDDPEKIETLSQIAKEMGLKI